MRVIFLGHTAKPSGAELALLRLLPAIQGDVDAHVVLGQDGPLVRRLREANVRVDVLSMPARAREVKKDAVTARGVDLRALIATARYVKQLVEVLRRERPDLVHTNSLKAALYGGVAGRLAGVPVVWHVRDRIADDYLPGSAVRLVRGLARVLPSAVVGNSRATIATLPKIRGAVVVVDNVVQRSTRPRQACPQDRTQVVGLLGRLAPWKGQDVFLRAFAAAFDGANVRAHVVGSAMFGEEDYEAELHALVAELGIEGQVEFRGFREDVWSEIDALDLLVHCSVVPEPFGQVVIEGMVSDVPVIAADAGGPAEVITDGVDGLLVPPGDTDALAAAMTRLLADREFALELARNARETSKRFSPEAAAEKLLEVYDRVLTKRGRR